MNRTFSFLALVLLISACSAPKYTYYFDTYQSKPVAKAKAEEKSPLAVAPETLTASASDEPMMLPETHPAAPIVTEAEVAALKQELKSMTKEEKKALRKELITQIKNKDKQVAASEGIVSADAAQAMDGDLKFALIFGIAAIVLGIFSWVLGTIALIVALFFLIRWLMRQ